MDYAAYMEMAQKIMDALAASKGGAGGAGAGAQVGQRAALFAGGGQAGKQQPQITQPANTTQVTDTGMNRGALIGGMAAANGGGGGAMAVKSADDAAIQARIRLKEIMDRARQPGIQNNQTRLFRRA